MLRIGVRELVPGMVVALPIHHPDHPGHVLLKPGARLEAASIEAMRHIGIDRIWIQYLPTQFLLRYAGVEIVAEHARLSRSLSDCFDVINADLHADFDFHIYLDGIRSFMQRLLEDPQAAVFLGDIIDSRRPLLTHSTNVCYLSLLMGLKLGGYLVTERAIVGARRAQNVENLGVGALFHDVGVLRLAPAVVERFGRTGDERDPQWQRHAGLGFDTVRGRIAPTAAAVVLHHHQRLDGSGFPRRPRLESDPRPLAGGEIHIFSRIVGLADAFERARTAVSPEGLATSVPTVRAMRRVLGMVRGGKLDPVVFKALLAVVPAYAPGTRVRLSDGRACVVTGWDPAQPCRPRVNVFDAAARIAADDERPLGETIDLRKHPQVFITFVEGVSVGRDNFGPAYAEEFDTRFLFAGGAAEFAPDRSDTEPVLKTG